MQRVFAGQLGEIAPLANLHQQLPAQVLMRHQDQPQPDTSVVGLVRPEVRTDTIPGKLVFPLVDEDVALQSVLEVKHREALPRQPAFGRFGGSEPLPLSEVVRALPQLLRGGRQPSPGRVGEDELLDHRLCARAAATARAA